MALKVSTAQLIGTFLEVFGYGIYVTICPQALLVIHRRRTGTGLLFFLYATVVLTFILITTHLVVDVIRIFIAFTTRTNIPDAPETFFADVGTNLNIAKNTTVPNFSKPSVRYIGPSSSGVASGRSLSFPWFSTALTSVHFLFSFRDIVFTARAGQSVLTSDTFIASKYFFAATLAVNLVSSCLIAYKIWKIQSAVTGYVANMDRAQKAISIVLESASIYTTALVGMIILVCLDSAALFFFLDSMPPLIGLVFTYVVLRSSDNGKRSSFKGTRKSHDYMGTNTDSTGSPANEGVRVQLERVVYRDTLNAKPRLDPEIDTEVDSPVTTSYPVLHVASQVV
ncbi:hypothetical protein APHAL10511_003387 [Amanita phalloides]|nr:hypothetical protein APHAL10511_003387 [Amanita phalloides]